MFCDKIFKKIFTVAPIIPENVSNISSIFEECTNLTGTVIINAKALNSIGCAFARTSKPIILTGTSSKLNEIAATAIDYDSNPIGNVTVAQ